MSFEPGDWLFYDRPNAVPEPARFVRAGGKKVLIEVRYLERYDRSKTLHRRDLWVHPETIRPREFPANEFGDSPVKEKAGFSLDAWEHPAGRATHVFRDTGLWYGRVDGFEATAPCPRADVAVQHAWSSLESGAFAAQLATQIDCIEGWFRAGSCQPSSEVQSRRDQIRLCQMLEKVLQAFPAQVEKTGFNDLAALQARRMAAEEALEGLAEAERERSRG